MFKSKQRRVMKVGHRRAINMKTFSNKDGLLTCYVLTSKMDRTPHCVRGC